MHSISIVVLSYLFNMLAVIRFMNYKFARTCQNEV